MNPNPPFKATSLNWDMIGLQSTRPPVLESRDIVQVAFMLEEEKNAGDSESRIAASETKFVLGQLNIQWRSIMGDRGSINTGWLTGKKR
jgi:trafficking protein particle complex subunit 13